MTARFSLKPAAVAVTVAVAVALAAGTLATVSAMRVATPVSNVQIDDWRMQGTATHAAWPVWRLRLAAVFGNAAAREALADVLVSSAQLDERREGVDLYRQLALDAVPSAQATLGHLLLRGLPGIAPDYAESRRWLSVAASHHPQAAHDLSTLYRNGELGMARDEDAYWAHVKESEHDLKHVSRP